MSYREMKLYFAAASSKTARCRLSTAGSIQEGGVMAKRRAQRAKRGRCEVCRRERVLGSLTILHDDTGDHELCDPCAEQWSRSLGRYFAREFMAFCQANAYRMAV